MFKKGAIIEEGEVDISFFINKKEKEAHDINYAKIVSNKAFNNSHPILNTADGSLRKADIDKDTTLKAMTKRGHNTL